MFQPASIKMCTLTYLPTSTGFILTHNRDELSSRPTSNSIVDEHGIHFPKDLKAGGTWFAAHKTKGVACILNGGSKTYTRKNEYRQSRGLIPLHYFNFQDVDAFLKGYDFSDIEPFTLICARHDSLSVLVHNEFDTYLEKVNKHTPQIWASTTLYTQVARTKREKWFANWLEKHPDPQESDILNFHQKAGDGDPENDMIMSRWGMLSTSSITQISFQKSGFQFYFHNLISGKKDLLKK